MSGGIACYINKRLQIDCHVSNLTMTTNDYELMTLHCVYNHGKVMYIMVVYRPPDGSVSNFLEYISNLIEEHALSQKELWIIGDCNIDFLKKKIRS